MQDDVEASWEKTKAVSFSAGERSAKLTLHAYMFDSKKLLANISILAQKTVDAIDSGLKASGDAAAQVLGKLRTSNKQSYDLTKNE